MSAVLYRLSVADNLKDWMIMIPLLKTQQTRVASGAWCGGKGCCMVSGGQPGRSYILPLSTPGRENEKIVPAKFLPVQCVEYSVEFYFILQICRKEIFSIFVR